jgi:hypothetical protein
MIESERPKTRNRMILYIILAAVNFAMGNLTADMFPSPEVHRWTMFVLGFTSAIALAIRTFIDRTASEESQELQGTEPPQPVIVQNPASDPVQTQETTL